MKKLLKIFFIICILGYASTGYWARAEGASLQFSPSTGTFFLGSTFNVSFTLNTGGRPVNALLVRVTYPADKVQVANPSIGTSFVSIWVTPPSYSNTEGKLMFQGGVPSPGIVTSEGVISTALFRARDVGDVELAYEVTSEVLANDGKATNILSSRGVARFTIVIPPPEGPIVFSPTHPNSDVWYTNGDVNFFWERAENVDDFSYSLSENPFEVPDESPEGPATSAIFADTDDGIWYFHLRSHAGGIWGGVTHYLVRIDRTPPAGFFIGVDPDGPYTPDVQPTLSFFTTDGASGVDHYDIRTVPLKRSGDEQGTSTFFIEETSPYRFPIEARGGYQVVVRAFDKAGNSRDVTARLELVPAASERITREGFRIFGFRIKWLWLYLLLGLLLILLLVLVWMMSDKKRAHEERLEKDLADMEKKLLHEYQEMYEKVKQYRIPAKEDSKDPPVPPPA